MKRIGYAGIIHGFALLHAVTTVVCYAAGISDTLLLTLLTVIMTALICIRERLSLELTVTVIILANIIGYLLGMAVAIPFTRLPEGYAHALSTFLTTELMGWLLVLFFRWFPSVVRKDDEPISTGQIAWVAAAVAVVLLIRIALTFVLKTPIFDGVSILDLTATFLSNSLVLLLMTGGTLLFFLSNRRKTGRDWSGFWPTFLFFCGISVAAALVVGLVTPSRLEADINWVHFFELLVIAAICEAAIYSLVFLAFYALSVRRRMEAERGRANLAQHEYRQLKQQVNPHFLFNSLNILDCLIADGKGPEARDYVHKLAALYRYMLRSENEPVVQLAEEMEYVRMYLDLLKVRFSEGLDVETDLQEEDLNRYIVKYSLQMLIENAQKHNSITPAEPLRLRISSDGVFVSVRNNRIPKLTPPESTGLGLKYISQAYRERSGKDIRIRETDHEYQVELPLL